MTDHDYRKRMTLAKHLTDGFEPETTKTIYECLAREYLKGRVQVHRGIFDKMEQYLHIADFVDVKAAIEDQKEAKLYPLREELNRIRSTMVCLDLGNNLDPLIIRHSSFYNLTDKCGGDKVYKRFLEFFYSCFALPTIEKKCYHISPKEWRRIKRMYGEYVKRLLEEEKTFFSEEGYFDVKRKFNDTIRYYDKKLAKMTEEELNKKLSFMLKDLRRIEIIG